MTVVQTFRFTVGIKNNLKQSYNKSSDGQGRSSQSEQVQSWHMAVNNVLIGMGCNIGVWGTISTCTRPTLCFGDGLFGLYVRWKTLRANHGSNRLGYMYVSFHDMYRTGNENIMRGIYLPVSLSTQNCYSQTLHIFFCAKE